MKNIFKGVLCRAGCERDCEEGGVEGVVVGFVGRGSEASG